MGRGEAEIVGPDPVRRLVSNFPVRAGVTGGKMRIPYRMPRSAVIVGQAYGKTERRVITNSHEFPPINPIEMSVIPVTQPTIFPRLMLYPLLGYSPLASVVRLSSNVA